MKKIYIKKYINYYYNTLQAASKQEKSLLLRIENATLTSIECSSLKGNFSRLFKERDIALPSLYI